MFSLILCKSEVLAPSLNLWSLTIVYYSHFPALSTWKGSYACLAARKQGWYTSVHQDWRSIRPPVLRLCSQHLYIGMFYAVFWSTCVCILFCGVPFHLYTVTFVFQSSPIRSQLHEEFLFCFSKHGVKGAQLSSNFRVCPVDRAFCNMYWFHTFSVVSNFQLILRTYVPSILDTYLLQYPYYSTFSSNPFFSEPIYQPLIHAYFSFLFRYRQVWNPPLINFLWQITFHHNQDLQRYQLIRPSYEDNCLCAVSLFSSEFPWFIWLSICSKIWERTLPFGRASIHPSQDFWQMHMPLCHLLGQHCHSPSTHLHASSNLR